MRPPNRRNSKEYALWYDLHRRCSNPMHYQFKHYGGRGIKVCARWETFDQFLADMGRCPPNMTLARVDLAKDYSPRNCLWAPKGQYPDARRQAQSYEFNGETRTLTEWSQRYKISEITLRDRLYNGWPLHLALKTPVKKRNV